MILICTSAALGGCFQGGTGPVVGVSPAGPAVGWEGAVGYGPLQGAAGVSLRPLGGERWGSVYAAAEPAVALPVTTDASTVALGLGVAGGGHLSSGSGGAGPYAGGFLALTRSDDGLRVCERRTMPTMSVTVGARFFVDGAGSAGLWEGYFSPKLGFVSDCADLSLGLRGP
jgi:hypothetical protein